MAKIHNKKRNIGIIYEQIIQHICNRLLDEDKHSAEKGIAIIKKYFKEGTQLNKEYKLFKALATTKNISEHLASSIINEAKGACNYHFDNKKLEQEKSKLIHDLNYSFGKGVIFQESIKNYRTYATIQTLLNEWRNKEKNFDKLAEFEIKLHNSLTANVEEVNNISLNENTKFDKMTYSIMKNIFNEKYGSLLNENQSKLIHFYTSDDNENLLKQCLNIKKSALSNLDHYINECNNNILLNKYRSVKQNISSLDENDISKENIQRFLTLAKLEQELTGE